MSETATAQALLIVALQDLLEGERAWLQRLPELQPKAPASIRTFMAGEIERSRTQAERLEALLRLMPPDDETMPNLWLCAILDDAARDSETIADGPLRAIAMVGAFRKGKQSERVSYETAIGLAEILKLLDPVQTLTRSRDEEAAADAELAQLLKGLLIQLG
jgi:ferritin-like metal-binding protein YciE